MSIDIPTAYTTKIYLPYGQLAKTIEWCKTNCKGEWKFGENPDTINSWTYYNFYFELEKDYVAFLLWHK